MVIFTANQRMQRRLDIEALEAHAPRQYIATVHG